jgi:hypothetical protein
VSRSRLALAIVLAASAAHPEISKRDMQALSKSQLIYIATVRKDGNQSKAAPVWFTLSADSNAILIQTGPSSWKAKRIRRGSPVLVWIGTAGGPAFMGKAEIISDAAVQKKFSATSGKNTGRTACSASGRRAQNSTTAPVSRS